jgi:hypothetical protein
VAQARAAIRAARRGVHQSICRGIVAQEGQG